MFSAVACAINYFCFDNDKTGKEAMKKYAENLRVMNPAVQLSSVELPNKDVNETLQLHDEEIFTTLLQERKFIFSDEIKNNNSLRTEVHRSEENGSGVADPLQSSEDGTGRRTGHKHQFRNVVNEDTTQTSHLL